MTEEQIPLMALMAFLGGCFAGAWTVRWNSIGVTLLVAAIILDIVGWMTYGFVVKWQPSWGIQDIIFGVLYAGLGMALFATVPAVAGFGLSVFVVRIIFRKVKHSDAGKRT